MADLVAGDPQILIQAIGISIVVRDGRPADIIAELLPTDADPAVVAELRNARLRSQRITGVTQTWLTVHEVWRPLP